MDTYKLQKPQFNVTTFGRSVFITANRKFVQDLTQFILAEQSMVEDYSDLLDDLTNSLSDNYTGADCEDYSCTRFKDVTVLALSQETADDLSRRILEDAGNCCTKNKSLALPSFVAFGKKLRDAAHGHIMPLQASQRPVREVIIRREIIR
jgi:hypothetical protein